MMDDLCLHSSNIKQTLPQIEAYVLSQDKPVRVSFKRWYKKRTLDQNSLMWKWYDEVVKQIAIKTGEITDDETLHDFLKKLYCPRKIKKVLSQDVEVISTKLLDTGEMTYYLNRIEQWAYERGFKLTIPDDCEYRKLQAEQVA